MRDASRLWNLRGCRPSRTSDAEIDRAAVLADLPPAVAELLTVAPQCAFDLFPPAHDDSVCWKVTTEEARAIVDTQGFSPQHGRGILMGTGWGYFFEMPPYLPHDTAVWCCGG